MCVTAKATCKPLLKYIENGLKVPYSTCLKTLMCSVYQREMSELFSSEHLYLMKQFPADFIGDEDYHIPAKHFTCSNL